MRRSITRVTSIPNVTKYVAGVDVVSGLESAIAVEMRVVVHLSSRPEYVDDLSAELVDSGADDDAFRCAQNWSAAFRKDVDALVRSASASRKAP